MAKRWWAPVAMLLALCVAQAPRAQGPPPVRPAAAAQQNDDLPLVEKLLVARRDYQKSLETLRAHYIQTGDMERAKWAEEELRQYHRLPKFAFRLDLDVPPPNLQGNQNIPEANKLYMRAMAYKDKGWGNDYVDNQRRAELLLQQLLTQYPQSDTIDNAAYMLGEIYESKPYKQYRRSAAYFERCFQWNPRTNKDARLRAARLYDKQSIDRTRAIELYREVTTHETDARRVQEAAKRLTDLSGNSAR